MNEENHAETMTIGENMAMCTYLLQLHANLTFNEATAYLWVCQFHWPQASLGKSRQATHYLKKRAEEKIGICGKPVLDMIEPYAEQLRRVWID